MGLDDNMRLGTAAAGYARLKVPISTNYDFTSSPIYRQGGEPLYKATTVQLMAVRGKMPKQGTQADWYKAMVKLALKNGAGNCHEVAAVAADYLKTKGATGVEIVFVLDDVTGNQVIPHVITVIGRTGLVGGGGEIGLPDSWGPDAVVCDAWDRVVYPAAMYDTFWDGLKRASKSPSTLKCLVDYQFC